MFTSLCRMRGLSVVQAAALRSRCVAEGGGADAAAGNATSSIWGGTRVVTPGPLSSITFGHGVGSGSRRGLKGVVARPKRVSRTASMSPLLV